MTKAADVEKLAADVEAALGNVDILINNAGINIRGPIQDLSEADWDAVIDTNLKGPWLCARAFGPRMAARGWGRVINIGSILAVIAMPGRTPYASSKAGVISMTRVLALEWAGTRRDRQRDLPGRVRHGDESSADERPREVQGVRRADSDGPMGRSARDRRRRGVPGVGRIVVHDRQLAVRGRRLDRAIAQSATFSRWVRQSRSVVGRPSAVGSRQVRRCSAGSSDPASAGLESPALQRNTREFR